MKKKKKQYKNWYDLNTEVAHVIVACTERMISDGCGYPFQLVIDDNDEHNHATPEGQQYYTDKWHEILTVIHDGFAAFLEEVCVDGRVYEDAMKAFAQWFPHLWD